MQYATGTCTPRSIESMEHFNWVRTYPCSQFGDTRHAGDMYGTCPLYFDFLYSGTQQSDFYKFLIAFPGLNTYNFKSVAPKV